MKPRNINNSLPLQPLVPDQENKNKKNEEKSVNPVKITMGSGLNYIEQESLGGKYLTHDLSIKIADISEEIIQQAILSAMSIYKFSITDDLMSIKPGGILMFGRDFEGLTKDEVKEKIQSYQDKSDIPLIIGADEEGGTVVRVSSNPNLAPEKFKSPQEIYNEGGMDAVVENATEKSELLLSLGVNMNLAPVADVSTNPSDYMYDRSLGQNAEVTADFVSKTVTAMNNAGIMSVLKHFPGYGGVGGDSHQGTVYDDKTAESIRENDLLPFKAGIEAGASSVLVAHNTVNALDSENPASLSPTIHNMLRDECGFDGVIMTDDIAMGAVADMENVYVKAVNAGNDLLITTDYQTGYNQILNAVKCGEISEETLNSAVERVLKMKGQI